MNRGLPLPVLARRDLADAARGVVRVVGNPALDWGTVMARPTDRLILTPPIRPTPRTPNQGRRAPRVHRPSAPTGRVREAPAGAASPIETSGLLRIVDTRLTMLAPKRAKKPDSSFLRRTKSSGRRSVTRGRRPRHRDRDPAPLVPAMGARRRAHPTPTTPVRRRPRGRRSGAVAADAIVLVRARLAPARRRVRVLRTRVARATVRVRRVGW